MGPSLVVSTIALTPVVSTYRPRGENFAGTISTVFLVSDVRIDRHGLVRPAGKLSYTLSCIGGADQHHHKSDESVCANRHWQQFCAAIPDRVEQLAPVHGIREHETVGRDRPTIALPSPGYRDDHGSDASAGRRYDAGSSLHYQPHDEPGAEYLFAIPFGSSDGKRGCRAEGDGHKFCGAVDGGSERQQSHYGVCKFHVG